MDGQRFDRWTRAFATERSRRSLLKLFGGGALAVAGTAVIRMEHVGAQGGGPGDPCAPGALTCAEGLLCAAEQEGVCYCEDPTEPWLGCACTTGELNPCGGISEAFGADYICCTYGDTTIGAIGWCMAQDECTVKPPDTGTGSAASDRLIAPVAALGAAAAVLAWKSRATSTDTDA
jgi:hypothetical protein